jgi:16S rRNA (guanine527-N7)-methyltransferase
MIDDELSAMAWVENLPECDPSAWAKLHQLTALLIEENARQNLVSSASLGQVWQRHIADSAQLLLHVPRETSATWLDLGTGAGFPGIVIAILRPDIKMLMVESRSKRTAWLEQACSTLQLVNSQIVESRLELVETRKMAVISARAFAPLDRLLKLSARFSSPDTQWLLPKGRSAAHELHELIGWQHKFHVEQSLTDRDAGLIVGQLNGKAGRSK